MNFWRWFFIGLKSNSGISNFLNFWLIAQLLIAIFLTEFVADPLNTIASTFLLPLAGIFTGLTFAWSSNVQALIQTNEIEELSKHHPDGIEHYIYTYQAGILTIFVTLIGWGLASLHIFENSLFSNFYINIKCLLFFLAIVSLSECWSMLCYNQSMLHIRAKIRDLKSQVSSPSQ